MPDERLITLIEKLIQRTQAGESAWEESGITERFSLNFEDVSIIVQLISATSRFYRLEVLNQKGTVVESTGTQGPSVDLGRRLSVLYEMARRRALKVDRVLDELIKRLDEQGLPGK